jgi:hypothetical protein
MKRHDHVVKHGAKDHVIKHGAKDHPAKQYGAEPDAREACLYLIILSGLFRHLLKGLQENTSVDFDFSFLNFWPCCHDAKNL